ncbi:MAG: phosphatidylserine decarboxylase family protein [Flavobacteriales bacterium]|jgi:phosphatidylserine decarboxylase
MYLHREGRSILITTFLVLTALVAIVHATLGQPFTWVILGVAVVVFGLFAQFFRVPKRVVTAQPNEVICPADGKVVVIERVTEHEYFKDERIQVSIFMSPLNVHVQWTPIPGKVMLAKYHPGLYLVAWDPKSSTDNERTTLVIKGEKHEVLFRQIAGAVARRIRYYIGEGQTVEHGEECGFIKFGSRVDVFLPLDAEICVELGQKVTGRHTVMAKLKN